jgi:hypothetical protein
MAEQEATSVEVLRVGFQRFTDRFFHDYAVQASIEKILMRYTQLHAEEFTEAERQSDEYAVAAEEFMEQVVTGQAPDEADWLTATVNRLGLHDL